jgi:hypothetical protein
MFLVEIPVRCLGLCLMAVTLSAAIDDRSLSMDDYEHLKRCWESNAQPNIEMQTDWMRIGELVHSSPLPPDLKASSKEVIEAEESHFKAAVFRAKDIYARLSTFKSNYVEFMDDAQTWALDRYIELSFSQIKTAEAFQYFYKSDLKKNQLEKLRLIKAGMDLYSESLPISFARQYDSVRNGRMSVDSYDNAENLLKKFLMTTFNLTDKAVSSELGFGRLAELRILQKSIKDIVMSLLWQVSRISEGRDRLGYFLSEFEGSFLVLESQSAEAKAIQRIRNPASDDEWELACKRGDKFDVDELDAQLRACGYID